MHHYCFLNIRLAWKSQIEDDPECGEPIFDRKGKNGAFRVAVATKDTVHLANIHDTTKEFVEKGKEEKNLTEMQLAAKKKEVLKHCDIEDDAQQMAANMVRKSGGSAFQGQTMDVNLDELVPSVEEPS